MRIGGGLTLDPTEMITAQGHPELRQATVEVRLLAVAPTVVVVEEVATVAGMRSPGEDMEEIMTVEVEAAEETTEGKVREEGIIGGMTVGKEEEVEEEGKEVAGVDREAPHGRAQATALLLQSRVGEEATTVDLAVED